MGLLAAEKEFPDAWFVLTICAEHLKLTWLMKSLKFLFASSMCGMFYFFMLFQNTI